MSRISLFNSPLLLGFDHFERVMDRLSKNPHEGYPPYNIEQWGQGGFRISIAVAGFARENLHVTLEDNQLIVRGKQEDDPNRIYLYRGIATRQFQRLFVLAEGIEVVSAQFDQGLLHIYLKQPPSQARVEEIPIEAPGAQSSHVLSPPARRHLVLRDESPGSTPSSDPS